MSQERMMELVEAITSENENIALASQEVMEANHAAEVLKFTTRAALFERKAAGEKLTEEQIRVMTHTDTDCIAAERKAIVKRTALIIAVRKLNSLKEELEVLKVVFAN